MIWRVTKPGAVNRAKHQWHWWFAWYPVRVPTKGRMSKQHKVWLQRLRRRIKFEQTGLFDVIITRYYALPGGEFWNKKKIGNVKPEPQPPPGEE